MGKWRLLKGKSEREHTERASSLSDLIDRLFCPSLFLPLCFFFLFLFYYYFYFSFVLFCSSPSFSSAMVFSSVCVCVQGQHLRILCSGNLILQLHFHCSSSSSALTHRTALAFSSPVCFTHTHMRLCKWECMCVCPSAEHYYSIVLSCL